eukprot:TRINITY_DN92331_c0_g1_i1.p1 TRINITY_DN92331_c0_g1~~TRINITY_DN92331_c0_g1_i1.p1  ORF type:complete len:509 (-),score=77.97 TRINITY_DN92331_c0_g1_i1:93-1466(-)
MLGPKTKGSCKSIDIPIPFVPDPVFGRCYEYRNAVCKASECRCLDGQELDKDGEFCVNPGVCSKHLPVACSKPLLGGDPYCPDWTEGAYCETETNQCKCKDDDCAAMTWWNDPYPRCRKPHEQQTCNKMTGGTCRLAALGHQILDELGGQVSASLGGSVGGVAKGAVKNVAGGAAKNAIETPIDMLLERGSKTAIGMLKDQLEAGTKAIKEAADSDVFKKDGKASLAGHHTSAMVSIKSFGDAANCDGWRDAVCSYPILNNGMHGVLSAADSLQDSLTGAHGRKSYDCMCRPTDCTVYSKKHSGLACVYGPLLVKLAEVSEDFQTDVTFERVSDHVYQQLSRALYGKGMDDSESFFTIEHRQLLRDYANHHSCISAMRAGDMPHGGCREYVCHFAGVATGIFPKAWLLCGGGGGVVGASALAVLAASALLSIAGIMRWRPGRDEAKNKDFMMLNTLQ